MTGLTSCADLIAAGVLTIGDGYRAKNDELGAHGLPFARAGNIDGGFDFDGADRFPESDLARVGDKVSRPGDVVFTSKGTVGRFAFVRPDTPRFVYSPQLCFWRSQEPNVLDPRFLYYWMHGPEFLAQVGSVKGQTDMADYVSLRDQRRMSITIPTHERQRAIVRALGSLDDRIGVNTRSIELLEAMARAWFERLTPDVDDGTAETAPVSALVHLNPTRRLRSGEPAPYLDMANMPTRSARASAWVTREAGSGARFMNGDVLVARITPCLENGKTAFVDFLEDGQIGWGSTEYIVLRSRPPLPEHYAYLLARTDTFRSHAIANMTGSSGRQRVPASTLADLQVPRPSSDAARVLGKMIAPLFEQMKALDEQSASMRALRDALLPRLLSGTLRADNAAVEVDAA